MLRCSAALLLKVKQSIGGVVLMNKSSRLEAKEESC